MTNPDQSAFTYIGPGDLDKSAEELHARGLLDMRRQMAWQAVAIMDSAADGHTYWPGEIVDGADSYYHPGPVEDCPTCNPTPVLVAKPDSKLAQLHAAYFERKDAADAAAKELKAVTDAIKTALAEAYPDQRKTELHGPGGAPLVMSYVTSWRVETAKLKREYPEVYAYCATESGSYRLEKKRGA